MQGWQKVSIKEVLISTNWVCLICCEIWEIPHNFGENEMKFNYLKVSSERAAKVPTAAVWEQPHTLSRTEGGMPLMWGRDRSRQRAPALGCLCKTRELSPFSHSIVNCGAISVNLRQYSRRSSMRGTDDSKPKTLTTTMLSEIAVYLFRIVNATCKYFVRIDSRVAFHALWCQ